MARILLRKAANNGSIRSVEAHSKQAIYTPTVQIAEKQAEAPTGKAAKGKGKGNK